MLLCWLYTPHNTDVMLYLRYYRPHAGRHRGDEGRTDVERTIQGTRLQHHVCDAGMAVIITGVVVVSIIITRKMSILRMGQLGSSYATVKCQDAQHCHRMIHRCVGTWCCWSYIGGFLKLRHNGGSWSNV